MMIFSRKEKRGAPPVLVLGGEENALSIARSFGRHKVPVYVCAAEGCFAFKSRYCTSALVIPGGESQKNYWKRVLLNDENSELAGAVIFPGNDEAVEFLAANRAALAKRFIIDDALPEISIAMLSKVATLELAQKLGCPAPAFHCVESLQDIARIEDGIFFPVMVKPVHSHLFRAHFPNRKYLVAGSKAGLHAKVKEMLDKGLQMIVTEIIPGPDQLQSAYFCYMTRDGKILFEYTHQIFRRFPKNSGSACLTISKRLPATEKAGRQFLQGAGFTGLGHVEFKYDERDHQLKIIECNPRTSAAQAVVTRSGLDMPWLIYNYLLTGEVPAHIDYQEGVRRWWVLLDILSFIELRRLGEITFAEWVRSIKGSPLVFPYFCLDDPAPFFSKARKHLSYTVGKTGGFHGKRKQDIARRADQVDAEASEKSRL
jgi:D-aspartate ligase